MARPKYEDGQKHAQKRLEEAFWKLLADYPLEKITINLLSKEANVNHNMIYYYYGNVLEMAETIINSEVDFRFTNSFLDAFLLADTTGFKEIINSSTYQTHWQHLRIIFQNSSLLLHKLITNKVKSDWLEHLHLDASSRSDEQDIEFNFIIAGLMSLFRSDYSDDKILRENFFKSPIADGIRKTIQSWKETVSRCQVP